MRQCAQRLRQRHPRIRPVQQQQIDLGEPQFGQALLGGSLEIVGREMRRLNHEYLVAPDLGGAQALADLALVFVDLCGVDVAISAPQCLLDETRTGAPAQLPGA